MFVVAFFFWFIQGLERDEDIQICQVQDRLVERHFLQASKVCFLVVRYTVNLKQAWGAKCNGTALQWVTCFLSNGSNV